MPHAIGLGAQVAPVHRIWSNGQRHSLDDLDAVSLQRGALQRVIGQQAHLAQAEFAQDGRGRGVFAPVNGQPQRQVGVYAEEVLAVYAPFAMGVICNIANG